MRIDAGLVDESDFDTQWLGRTAGDIWDEIDGFRSGDEQAVFTHGDFTLDNLLTDGVKVTGVVDWDVPVLPIGIRIWRCFPAFLKSSDRNAANFPTAI